MSDGTTPRADRAATAPADGVTNTVDWMRVERSDDFRELTSRRNRFIAMASAFTFACFATYLGLAVFAHGIMGTTVLGGVPIAWLLAMSQVLLTWVVTAAYLRKSDREFAPLERRIAERAEARFIRDDDPVAADGEPATDAPTATSERRAR
jgi:uncharacterized membrane protein (DUF485 family)